jgi:hypothetical protein
MEMFDASTAARFSLQVIEQSVSRLEPPLTRGAGKVLGELVGSEVPGPLTASTKAILFRWGGEVEGPSDRC